MASIASTRALAASPPYDIQRLIRDRHQDYAAGKTRALDTAAQGLIEPVERTREGKRPERTVYRITEAGRDALTTTLAELLAAPREEFPLFAVAISLADALRPASVRNALERLEQRSIALEGAIASLETWLRGLMARMALPRLVRLEVEYALAMRRAELEWTPERAGGSPRNGDPRY